MKNNNHYPTNGGAAMMIIVLFFVFISLTILIGIIAPTIQEFKIASTAFSSKNSYFLSESGAEDVMYRFKNSKQVGASETLSLNGGTTNIVINSTSTGKQIISTGNINNFIRKVETNFILGTGISFHYGVQAGNGGFNLSNSSSVTGNIHSGGPIVGAGNFIYGDAVSAGATGLIKGVHVTGSAYSHVLGASSPSTQVDKDAYYTSITPNVTVVGIKYPNSTDQATADLPISDDQINTWKSDAEAGGTLSSSACDSYSASTNTCTISSSMTLGPVKIPFNLLIKSSSGVLTVAGPLWVTGNITTQTGPTIRMSSSLGATNVAIIADNPSDRISSSIIEIGQSTSFQGSGSQGSFVFMISQNNSAENGGSVDAIAMNQGASALVAYASHGQITLSQSVSLKEVTAYKIVLTQSANVTYDTGLPSTIFATGPSGGYDILSWKEIP